MSQHISPCGSIVSTKLFRLFREYRLSRFLFVEPGGNFGDYLIWRGAEKLAAAAGIQFERKDVASFMKAELKKEDVVYIHGHGGYTSWWSGAPFEILKRAVSTHRGVVIQGPQTLEDNHRFLQEKVFGALDVRSALRVHMFAREERSYRNLQACAPKWMEIDIDHDTALNISPSELACSGLTGRFVLHSIREDPEGVPLAAREYAAVWLDPVLFCDTFEQWVELHSRARAIVTNRLHSACLGSLLGKPTTLMPNSYHKNRSVWEYSLQGRGVRWSDELPMTAVSKLINAMPPVRGVFSSTLVQRAFRVAYGVRYKSLLGG
ncbi:MAG: polysaccharide pyruvyl transferase family protein [Candidatus Omnitrophica bacterium]|nr:polysaccharide pyruvyl transferase family protein [Candidatus Omnitrophota bacterium]